MIVQKKAGGALAIKQADHAAFAAFMLEHWSDHRFPQHIQRDQIILATREHDDGWKKWDEAPRLDPKSKLPVDFAKITADEAQKIWTRAANTFKDTEPLVAVLIIHHAYSLHEVAHRRNSAWKQFFIDFAKRRADLRDQLGMTHNELEHSYSFLRMMDHFSLSWCSRPKLGSDKPERYAGYSIRRDENQYLFRPYPFDMKALRYQLPVYPMKKGGYEDEKELRKALKTPEYQEIILNPLERFA
jgi:hypothetical protein